MDPPTVHHLPPDIDETTEMGQQGYDELVPEGEYDVFGQAVWSSLGWFYSNGDNIDDFLEEIGSLTPADEVLKDKIMWDTVFAQGFVDLLCQDSTGSGDSRQIVDMPCVLLHRLRRIS